MKCNTKNVLFFNFNYLLDQISFCYDNYDWYFIRLGGHISTIPTIFVLDKHMVLVESIISKANKMLFQWSVNYLISAKVHIRDILNT